MAGTGSWIASFFPALLMLMIVAMNHLITNQRNDRRLADETLRFRAALATELRALLDLYEANLGLIARKADYILSSRSSVVVYKGNLGAADAPARAARHRAGGAGLCPQREDRSRGSMRTSNAGSPISSRRPRPTSRRGRGCTRRPLNNCLRPAVCRGAGLLLCPQSSNETSQLACRPKGRQLGSDDRAKVGTKPLDVGDQPLMRGFDRRSESSSGAVPVFGRASMLPSATKQSREFPLPWLRPRRCTMSGRMPDCRRPAAPCLEMGGELPHYSFLGCPTAWPRPERQRSRD
jgi:hypothetical protein